MLRNRSRAVTKQSPIMADHQTSSRSSPATTQNPNRSFSYFIGSPRFFNGGFFPNSLLSPTSILDTHKQFPIFSGNPFRFSKNPEIPTKIFEKSKNQCEKFDSEGIALALVLVEENPNCNICKPNITSSSALFGSKLKIQIPEPIPNGSPGSPGDFGIKTRNSQFSGGPTPTGFGSPRFSTGPLSLSEMELTEEYTRVISHGPNPKTTHIYDNCVVESCYDIGIGSEQSLENIVSFCQTCKKSLGEGNDIFMYRGEKAFCSEECRCQEMVLDGILVNPIP